MGSTFVFAGGGSGGHLFPGIAVAHELRTRSPQTSIVFVGSERPVEQQILANQPFEHVRLPVQALGTARRTPLRFLWRNMQAVRRAEHRLRELQPEVVIGLGSFVSVPTLFAARRLGVPIVLIEQNLNPGRANCWMSRWAETVCVPFADTVDALPRGCRAVLTGNPIRREIAEWSSRSSEREARTLLILGGSQGAESLNAAVINAVKELRAELTGWQVVHQTGPRQCDAIRQHYADLGLPADVQPFFSDLPRRLARAGLVISRSGAGTLAELACSGNPAILLPFPHAAGDHQWQNAMIFERAGAALVVRDGRNTATVHDLVVALKTLMHDNSRRESLRSALRSLARPDAAARVAELILNVAKRRAA